VIIRKAEFSDLPYIEKYDKWIEKDVLRKKVADGQVYTVFADGRFAGWSRYGLFWDNTPYLNMLHLLPEYRGKGIGKSLVGFWEKEMKDLKHKLVLTSSAQTEQAQHFYVELGYKAVGSFTLANEPLEIIFAKFF